MSASSPCSASQLIALSSDSLPGWYGQGESAYEGEIHGKGAESKEPHL